MRPVDFAPMGMRGAPWLETPVPTLGSEVSNVPLPLGVKSLFLSRTEPGGPMATVIARSQRHRTAHILHALSLASLHALRRASLLTSLRSLLEGSTHRAGG